MFTQEQWTYLDIFVPMLLPVLDMQNNFQTVTPTYATISHVKRSFDDLNSLNEPVKTRFKRSLNELASTTEVPSVANLFEEFYDLPTTTSFQASTNLTNSARAINGFYRRNITDYSSLLNNRKTSLSAFDLLALNNLIRPKVSANSNLPQTGGLTTGNINPFSLLNIVSLLNGGGSGSATSVISTLTPLLTLIPLDQYFPGLNQQATSSLISTLPQVVKLIETFSNFHMPVSEVSLMII